MRALRGGGGPILVTAEARGRARVGPVRGLSLDGRSLAASWPAVAAGRSDQREAPDRECGDEAPTGQSRLE